MTSIILTLVGVFVTLLLLVERRSKLLRQLQRQQHSLQLLCKLQSLVALLQKHRGISAAFLRGERNALPPLGTLRSKISKKINYLNKQSSLKNLDRWQAFLDHWQRLRKNNQLNSVANSFEQHTNMIANLLLLFENIAETEKFKYKEFAKKTNFLILWRELPLLIEYMGQARGIGVGLVIEGKCSHDDKTKLKLLIMDISKLSKSVFLHLRENGRQTSALYNLIQQASESCARLTHTIQHQLIETQLIKLDVESYYAEASHAMEKSARLLIHEMDHLAEALTSA